MDHPLRSATASAVLLLVCGCAAVSNPPAETPGGPAPMSPAASAPVSESGSPSESASTATGPQPIAIEALGGSVSVPAEFLVMDKSKADDAGSDSYWEEMAEATGWTAALLKDTMSRMEALAVDPAGTSIAISKQPDRAVPSVESVSDELEDQNVKADVTEVETPLGTGTRVSISSGEVGEEAQEFAYVPGPNSVLGINVSSADADTASAVLDQVLATLLAS